MVWLWLGAFAFLGLLAAFCFLVLRPYLEVRGAIDIYLDTRDATKVIERLGGPRAAARKLVLYSRLPDRFASHQGSAMGLMGCCGSEAVPRLLELLRTDIPIMRMVAAGALGRTGDQRAVEPLIVAMRDPDEDVSDSAIWALGRLGGDRAVKVLAAALKDHPDQRVRKAAAEALGWTRAKRALDPLIAALGDKAPAVRSYATIGLGYLGDPRAIPALEALLARETDQVVLQWARRAMVEIRAPKKAAGP
jgi:hypothetical protein